MSKKFIGEPIVILMADDDDDDRLLAKDAFQESQIVNDLYFVEDGVDLLEYLRREGKYAGSALAPKPDLILLDLNMPRKGGREALQELKADRVLRHIPVVILTTSQAEEDILDSYDIGAAGFISKPVTFEGLVAVIRKLGEYWVQIVRLPSRRPESDEVMRATKPIPDLPTDPDLPTESSQNDE